MAILFRPPANSILLYPGLGLGNRMLAIGAGIELGRATGKRVYLYWQLNRALSCRFDELFERTERLTLTDLAWQRKLLKRLGEAPRDYLGDDSHSVNWNAVQSHSQNHWIDGAVRRRQAATPDRAASHTPPTVRRRPLANWAVALKAYARRWSFDTVLRVPHGGYITSAEVDNLRRRKRILITSAYQFYPAPSRVDQNWDHLVPRKSIRDAVEQLASQFAHRTVGVHIRRGDFVRAGWARHSPTALFTGLMEDEIDRDGGVRFYLATDSEQEFAELQARFGRRIIGQAIPQRASRRGADAARAAVVDMYALARTARIMASVGSSFSHMAARIGQTEYHVVDARQAVSTPAGSPAGLSADPTEL